MLPWLPQVTWLRAAGFLALGLTLVLAVAAFVFARFGAHAARLAFRPLVRFTFLPRESIERAPDDFMRGLGGLLRPRIAIVAFAWTTFSWLIIGAACWLVILAFHLGLSPVAGLLVVIGIGLAMILPSSPAALGVFEGAAVVVLVAYGIADSRALSYALVLHALSFLPFIVLAVPVLGTRLLQHGPAIADAEPPGP
jgi:glycosyltransferase 2 family protein